MDHTTDRQIPHRVFFDAAAAAYEDGSPPPNGYRPVKRFEHRRSGFTAVVYENDEGERIYAIAGAEIGRDFAASVRLGEEQFGSRPFGEMIEDAREYSKKAGKTVTFTGHSLCGGQGITRLLQGHVAQPIMKKTITSIGINAKTTTEACHAPVALPLMCEKNLLFSNQRNPIASIKNSRIKTTNVGAKENVNIVNTSISGNTVPPGRTINRFSMSAGSQFRATPWPEIPHSHAVWKIQDKTVSQAFVKYSPKKTSGMHSHLYTPIPLSRAGQPNRRATNAPPRRTIDFWFSVNLVQPLIYSHKHIIAAKGNAELIGGMGCGHRSRQREWLGPEHPAAIRRPFFSTATATAKERNRDMEPGIYLEVKPATIKGVRLGSNLHAYLVYRKDDGTTEVIRGGPDLLALELQVETGKSLDSNAPEENKSEDAHEGHATPGSRPSRRLSLGGRKPEDVWKLMKKRAEEIGARKIVYFADFDPEDPNQNSNSLTAAVLKAAGIPLGQSVPDGIKIDDLPGIKNDLSNPLKRIPPMVDPDPASRSDRKGKEDRAAAADPAATSPEARKFLDDVVKPGSPADEILLKPVSKWTDDELGVVMGARLDLPSGHPDRNRMADKETEFFKRFHGDGATPPIPKDPTPARAPDGGDLASALRRVGADVVRAAGRDGLPPALRDLQRGINLKRDAAMELKVDGAFGPLTRTALRRATADQGSAGVERLFALGRFHGFAEDAERDGPADLKDTLEAVFADPGRTPARPVGALKRTLNNLGQIHFGGDAWRPLDDNKGRIGPETTSAFAKVLRAAGPKLFAERFGRFLGIL